jgi:hypothetical protein
MRRLKRNQPLLNDAEVSGSFQTVAPRCVVQLVLSFLPLLAARGSDVLLGHCSRQAADVVLQETVFAFQLIVI